MDRISRAALTIAILALSAAGRADPSIEIAVVANVSCGVRRLDANELAALFSAARHRWARGTPVVALNLPPGDPVRGAFDRAVLHLDAEEVGRFWIDERIRGGARPPRQVNDPPTVVRVVALLEGSIGYVPASAVRGPVIVVARIRNGSVVTP
jgi:hypothetical protein